MEVSKSGDSRLCQRQEMLCERDEAFPVGVDHHCIVLDSHFNPVVVTFKLTNQASFMRVLGRGISKLHSFTLLILQEQVCIFLLTHPPQACVRTAGAPVWRWSLAVAVRDSGDGEIVGLGVGPSEDEALWTAFLRQLVALGLKRVLLAISDSHFCLREAIRIVLSGASWQRCRVHFVRNRVASVPKHPQSMVASSVGRSSPSQTSKRPGTNSPLSSTICGSSSPGPLSS